MSETGKAVIQGLWIGGRLSRVEQLCVRSFLRFGHPFHLYVYEPAGDVPEGATIRDAREIVDEKFIFRHQEGWGKGSLAGFSDVFRYELLLRRGGWWVDMDVLCIRPFPAPGGYAFASTFEYCYGEFASTCVLHMPVGSAFAKSLVDAIDWDTLASIEWGQYGPGYLQRMIAEQGLTEFILPWHTFCPWQWRALDRFFFTGNKALALQTLRRAKDVVRERVEAGFHKSGVRGQTLGVHLHNEIWRQNGWNKDARFHPLSPFERIALEIESTPSGARPAAGPA
jgi:hypothetical protein